MKRSIGDDLIGFIERQIDERGLVVVVLFPVTVAGVLKALDLAPPGTATTARYVIVAVVLLLLIGLSLRAKQLRQTLRDTQDSIADFVETALEKPPHDYELADWVETAACDPDKLTATRTMTIRAGQDPVAFCWQTQFGWKEEVPPKVRDKVKVTVRSVKNDVEGAGLPIFTRWVNSGCDLRIYVILRQELKPGELLTLRFASEWPGYKHFTGGVAKSNWHFHRKLDHFKLTYSYAAALMPDHARIDHGSMPLTRTKSDGRVVLASDWPAPDREFGIVIDAK